VLVLSKTLTAETATAMREIVVAATVTVWRSSAVVHRSPTVHDMDAPPEKSTARELIEKAVEGSAGIVPIVGGPLAVALALAMGWAHSRRMDAWMSDVAEAITELQEATEDWPSFEELAEDAVFVDAVVNATRAAAATHQSDKLEALRNGILNSLGPEAPSADEQARFFSLVDQFTPSHLRLLAFLHDPAAAFVEAGIASPTVGPIGSRSLLLDQHPEFKDAPGHWLQLLRDDLAGAHLTAPWELQTMLSGDRRWESATTPLGSRFLAFIRDPSSVARKN